MVSSAGDFRLGWVKDARGARGSVSDQVVTIVKHDVPSARFVTRDNSCFIPGLKNHSIQIELSGSPPFAFELDGRKYSTVNSTVDHPISSAGSFQLLALKDRFCAASAVIPPIRVREMPRVTVEGNNVVCEGEQSKIVFRITGGTPPYRLSYTDGTPEVTVSHFCFDVLVYFYRLKVLAGHELEIVAKQQGALVYATGIADQFCYFGRANN